MSEQGEQKVREVYPVVRPGDEIPMRSAYAVRSRKERWGSAGNTYLTPWQTHAAKANEFLQIDVLQREHGYQVTAVSIECVTDCEGRLQVRVFDPDGDLVYLSITES